MNSLSKHEAIILSCLNTWGLLPKISQPTTKVFAARKRSFLLSFRDAARLQLFGNAKKRHLGIWGAWRFAYGCGLFFELQCCQSMLLQIPARQLQVMLYLLENSLDGTES